MTVFLNLSENLLLRGHTSVTLWTSWESVSPTGTVPRLCFLLLPEALSTGAKSGREGPFRGLLEKKVRLEYLAEVLLQAELCPGKTPMLKPNPQPKARVGGDRGLRVQPS